MYVNVNRLVLLCLSKVIFTSQKWKFFRILKNYIELNLKEKIFIIVLPFPWFCVVSVFDLHDFLFLFMITHSQRFISHFQCLNKAVWSLLWGFIVLHPLVKLRSILAVWTCVSVRLLVEESRSKKRHKCLCHYTQSYPLII